jgi:hypothetical protein
MSQKLLDPRFNTMYVNNYNGPLFYQNAREPLPTLQVPAFAVEQWCEPGYQPKRPNKGVMLTVNDYTFHNIEYGGGLWPSVVYTPFHTPNRFPDAKL